MTDKLLMILPFVILFFTIWTICSPSKSHLTLITIKDCDREKCEQMREAGRSETEIEEFMDNCGGYYEPPTPSGKDINHE